MTTRINVPQIAVTARVRVREGKVDEYLAAFAPLLEQVEQEPGTLLYVVQRSDGDRHVFWTSEIYADEAAFAVAKASGPQAGITLVADLAADPRLRNDHRVHTVRAHLLVDLGDLTAARRAFEHAAALAKNLAQRRYLATKAGGLPQP